MIAQPGLVQSAKLTSLQEWQHYSSVRNVNGPRTGIPNVQVDLSTSDSSSSQRSGSTRPEISFEMIRKVASSVSFPADGRHAAAGRQFEGQLAGRRQLYSHQME